MSVEIQELNGGRIDPVLKNLLEKVDNIETPSIDELKEILSRNGKVYEMRNGEDVVAHFFTDIQGDTLVLECMLGKAVNGVDPCIILDEFANEQAAKQNLSKIRISTKRAGVVKKFMSLGFNVSYFVIEKQIQ